MHYNFDEKIDRLNSYSGKDKVPEHFYKQGIIDRCDDTVFSMMIADMEYGVAQPIVDALHEQVDKRIYGYTFEFMIPEYYNALIRWFHERHNWDFTAQDVVYCSGTIRGLFLAVQALTHPGNKVIIQPPVYAPFYKIVRGAGCQVVENRLCNNNGYYTIDYADLEKKCADPAVKMLLFCNPQMPTGRCFTAEEIKKVTDICERHGVIIVSDEVHGDTVRTGTHYTPIANVCGDRNNILVFTSPSKPFNMTGLHSTSAIIYDPAKREAFSEAKFEDYASPMTIAATIAAYDKSGDWLDQVNAYLDGTLTYAYERIQKELPSLVTVYPEGTYCMWLDFTKYGLDPNTLQDKLFREAGLLMEEGYLYDETQGHQFYRLCAAFTMDQMKQIMDNLVSVFGKLEVR